MFKLKSGHIIKTKNEMLYEYFDEDSVFGQAICRNFRDGSYFTPAFNEKLEDVDDDDFSVTEIYRPENPWDTPENFPAGYELVKIIRAREMTLEEIEEALGYPVKIIDI